MPEEFGDAELLGRIVLDDQQALAARPGVFLDLRQRRADAFGRGRLVDERERAARQRVLAIGRNLLNALEKLEDQPGRFERLIEGLPFSRPIASQMIAIAKAVEERVGEQGAAFLEKA